VGDLWTELPFRVSVRDRIFVGIDSRVSLEQPSDFTFEVRDLQYRLSLGWRGRPGWAGNRGLSAYVAQRGRENVDREGQPWVQYVAAGLESPAFRDRRARRGAGPALDWRIAAGPVLDEREVEADAVFEGESRWWLGPAGFAHGALALELEWDALVGDGFDPDYAFGPRFAFAVPGGRTAALYLHYAGASNPLGSEESLWLLGFAYEEGETATDRGLAPPQIDGRASLGAGEGRLAGELGLRFFGPRFRGAWYPAVRVQGNILTADDTGDLWYVYAVSLERTAGAWIAGGGFYHRSNHVLAEPNDLVTSLDVLEGGLESASWHAPAGRSPRWLDGFVRAGWLASSSFGEERRWHLRGGARLSLPASGGWPEPYLIAEGETGDIRRASVAVGIAPAADLEVEIGYRDDEQLFSSDREATLAVVRYAF
jgi:hypothetical protein